MELKISPYTVALILLAATIVPVVINVPTILVPVMFVAFTVPELMLVVANKEFVVIPPDTIAEVIFKVPALNVVTNTFAIVLLVALIAPELTLVVARSVPVVIPVLATALVMFKVPVLSAV